MEQERKFKEITKELESYREKLKFTNQKNQEMEYLEKKREE